MGDTLFSAYVDANGVIHKSIGENIRKGAKDVDSFVKSFNDNTKAAKMTTALHVTSSDLKTALIDLLTGQKANFGGLDVAALSATELANIKKYLGVTTA